ncbi:MAG: PAS domain S-box protein [Arcobacteraceae bacterium]
MNFILYFIIIALVCFFIYKLKQEITHRKKLEEKLKASETLYNQLTQTVIDVIWKTDKNYCFTYISPSVEQILGFKPEELIGRHVFDIFSENGIKETIKRMEERKKDEANGIFLDYSILEIEHKSKYGALIWGEIVSKVELDENNNIIGYHGISRNTTQRKELEKEKELLFQELEHRVKNNLQIISSIVSLHTNKKDTSQALKDIHNTISAISIAHDKLQYSNTNNSLEISSYIGVLLDNLLSSSILNIQKEVNASSIYLETQQAVTLGIILNEFINNSIKYAFKDVKNPKITVTIKEEKEILSVVMSDNGVGFKENMKSSGLGMDIIKILVKSKFKTEVKFINNNGTVMKLKIPLPISLL